MVFTKITIMEEGLLIYVTGQDVFRTQKNLKKLFVRTTLSLMPNRHLNN